jgi:hypothetical protein
VDQGALNNLSVVFCLSFDGVDGDGVAPNRAPPLPNMSEDFKLARSLQSNASFELARVVIAPYPNTSKPDLPE